MKKQLLLFFILIVSFFKTFGQTAPQYIKAMPTKIKVLHHQTIKQTQLLNNQNVFVFDERIDVDCDDIVFPDSLHDGTWIAYYKTDSLHLACRVTYKKGMPNGPVETYYLNGNLKEQYCLKQNKPEGKCYFFHSNGQLRIVIKFKHGELDEKYVTKELDEQGNIVPRYKHQDGLFKRRSVGK